MQFWEALAFAAVITVSVGVAGSESLAASAQKYPQKPIRIIAETAGSSTDFLARYIGQRLNERWHQPIIVENRGGAGVSATLVSGALPDGYTLWMGSTPSLASAVSLYKKLAYDPVKDFAPITLVSKTPFLLVANPSVPAASLSEFMQYARQRPGTLSYASGGSGTGAHLTGAFFRSLAGIEMSHVPYKGAAAAVMALLAGEAAVATISAPSVVPQVRAGKLKAYAVTSGSRFAALPGVPTAVEAGLPGFEATAWYGMLAPAGTSPAIIGKLNRDIVKILHETKTIEVFLAQGAEAAPGTPAEFGAWIRSEILKWARVIAEAGIRPE